MFSKKEIENQLHKLGIQPPKIVFFEETDSTNTRAREYAKEAGDKQNVIFIANSQSAGRGRRGRSFVSEKGAGIYMSILTYPSESGADATQTTARAAVNLARAIESVCPCEIKIKWVNDLFLGGKKLAGILTEGEMDSNGKIAYQVVGMGINVYKNAVSGEISTIATSIEEQTGHGIDRSKLSAAIIKEFLDSDDNPIEEYRTRSCITGENVTVVKLTESYVAKVIGIDDDYALLIERDGKVERLFTGEVSLRI